VEIITNKCNQLAQLMGLSDATWSTVRGIDGGLLPTQEQVVHPHKALAKAKHPWVEMKLSALQQK
jgi:hypothetical protein